MKPKILFILHYPPPVHGAAMVGQYIRESEVVHENFDCQFINLGTSRTVDEIGKNGLRKWLRYFSIILETITTLIRFKPNLVYLTLTAKGGGFYKDSMIALIAKVFGKKVVYHFHNKGVSLRQDKTIDNLLYKTVFKNSSVILLSEHLYSDIKKYVELKNVHFCLNGIPDLAITEKHKDSIIKDKINILFLSNLLKTKGVFVLLEACALLRQNGFDFHCTLVGGEGDVSEKRLKEKVEELNLKDYVTYVGKKFGREKEDQFLKANIFVFPTYYETFPLVILEAMQFSLPVISTFEGAIPEIIQDGATGFLVPPKDVKALADKLEILINDPILRIEMGKAGRLKYEKEFTLAHFEKNITEIFQNIIEKQQSKH